MDSEPPKVTSPAREEYSQLRAEMTQLLVSERTAWLAVITTLAAVTTIFPTLMGQFFQNASVLDNFMRQGWCVVASNILILFQIAIASLADRWLREAYNIGSYLIVFHERRDPSLEWLTRNRKVDASPSRDISKSPSVSRLYIPLSFVLGLLPTVVCLVWVDGFCKIQSTSFYLSLATLIAVLLLYYWQIHRLSESSKERDATTKVWEKEWDQLHKSPVPVDQRGYRRING